VRFEAIGIRADLVKTLNNEGKGVAEGEHHCDEGEKGQHRSRERREAERTEEVREPLVVDLQLLVRDAGDESDDVPLGTESEDVGEETERHHACPDSEGRGPDVPARG
jgi:hypothetical protein